MPSTTYSSYPTPSNASSVASFHSWLANLPTTTDCITGAAVFDIFEDEQREQLNTEEEGKELEQRGATATRDSSFRHHPPVRPGATSTAASRKRKRLGEISANTMMQQDSEYTGASLRKSQRYKGKGTSRDKVVAEDYNATPKSNKSWQPAPALTKYPTPQSAELLPPASPTRSRSQSSQSSTSSPSRSPTRKIVDFALSNLPITRVTFTTPGFPIPKLAQPLFKDIRNIYEHGDGVVPSYFEKLVDFEEESIRRSQVSEYKEEGWSQDEFFHHIRLVKQATVECITRDVSEAEWNSEVHSRVLRLALHGTKGAWYHDVTTARIHDRRLIPRVSNVPLQNKMVDYCIVLRSLEGQVKEKLKTIGSTTINHTDASYLRYNPIAVSIETKRGGEEEETVNVQLGVWVCAHFTKLRQLVPDGTPMLPLILILVQGPDWKMMIADAPDESGVVMFRYQMMGQTEGVLGLCKLVASIRRIGQYANQEYTEWFKTYVLDST